MLIYITSGVNENIFDKICENNNIHLTKFKNILNLNNFYSKNNFENCKILAVDLSIIGNTDDEILEFFLKFRQLYDAKIVIVAIGRKVGDILLSKLVSESIFNFIISEDTFLQKEEIKKCILGNNEYKDCVKFKVVEVTQNKENSNKLNIIKGFLDKINKSKIDNELPKNGELSNTDDKKLLENSIKENVKQEDKEPVKPQIIEKIIEREKVVEKKVIVRPKININKLKIAVCGTCSRMGATTQAFLIANYLVKYKFNTCYIEANGKNSLSNVKNFYDVLVDDKNKKISYKWLDIFANVTLEDLPNILSMNYEVFIFDYGEFLNTFEESFASADIRIVVSGAKFWEEKYIENVFKICNIYKDINFIFNFVDEEEQDFILKNMEGLKVYFSEYCPNIFKIYNEKIYQDILKNYLSFNEVT